MIDAFGKRVGLIRAARHKAIDLASHELISASWVVPCSLRHVDWFSNYVLRIIDPPGIGAVA